MEIIVNGTLSGVLVVALAIGFYFLPSLVAAKRKHCQYDEILLMNFFLGWTVIGWMMTLAFSFSSDVEGKTTEEYDLDD
jgi:hypothetical protein